MATPFMSQVHGPEICRALLSKLINSAFGVVLKEVNARYTNLATNKKMRLGLREELKVTSHNPGDAGASNSLKGFVEVIEGRPVTSQQSVGVEGALAVTGAEKGAATAGSGGTIQEELEEGVDFEAMLGVSERIIYGEDDFYMLEEDAENEGEEDEEEEGSATNEWVELEITGKEDGINLN